MVALDMSDKKFHHNTDTLLEMAKKVICKSPKHFTIDDCPHI